MRKFLIAVVLLLTSDIFYSALWFKTDPIGGDITARVTDVLDGRYVTLSGVVFDEHKEQAFLATADETDGAL